MTKVLWLSLATQLPTQGQWWSNLSTQLSQMEQCEARGGRNILQVKQNLSLTVCPLTCTSLVLGGGLYAAPAPFPGCSISLSIYSASAMVALKVIFVSAE